MPSKRAVPRRFELHFGSGEIIEEACFSDEHHEPAIQLLRFDAGEAAGTESIRFCYFSRDGRFQRSPLMLSAGTIPALREALRETPRLRELLKQLVE